MFDFNLGDLARIFRHVVFVCVTLIGVKSKYGSCNGNCTGLIKIKNTPLQKIFIVETMINIFCNIRKVPFVGMTGWAVNSIAMAVEGSSPFLPINNDFKFLHIISISWHNKYYK